MPTKDIFKLKGFSMILMILIRNVLRPISFYNARSTSNVYRLQTSCPFRSEYEITFVVRRYKMATVTPVKSVNAKLCLSCYSVFKRLMNFKKITKLFEKIILK